MKSRVPLRKYGAPALRLASSVAGSVDGKNRSRVSMSPIATITLDGIWYWKEKVPLTLVLNNSSHWSPESLARTANCRSL